MINDTGIERRTALRYIGGAAALTVSWPALGQEASAALSGIPGSYGQLLPSLKRNSFVKRKAGISHDHFVREWIGTHGDLLAQQPGLAGLVLNVVDRERSPEIPFDGVAEFFYQNDVSSDLASGRGSSRLQHDIETHAQSFLEPHMQMFTREIVFRKFEGAHPATAIKRLGLVTRKESWDRQDFVLDWRDKHGPQANAMHGLIRYTINVTEPGLSPNIPYDGFAELWWKDWDSYLIASEQRLQERQEEAQRGLEFPSKPATLFFVQPYVFL